MTNFYDYTLERLSEELVNIGKKKFRAEQIYKWVYQKGITNFDQMTNISGSLKEEMKEKFLFDLPVVQEHLISQDGTQKFLFGVGQNLSVESVIIPSESRSTLCVSSEVGCNLACKFCYTGKQKLKRRLTASEIVGQFIVAQKSLEAEGKKITNIVFMGMGEPLDNPENVFAAIEILCSDTGFNLSKKRITVSTSGLVDKIPLVTNSGVHLAVSLNASNDNTRSDIMPINQKYNLATLLSACRDYCEVSKQKVTMEYVMLDGINDSLENAHELVHLLKDIPCKVNLIPFNEHPSTEYTRPMRSKVFKFQKVLLNKGIQVLIRKTMGRDIFAACGQLTSEKKGSPTKQVVETGMLG